MPQGECTVTIKAEWRTEDGTGVICWGCGDACWLTQKVLWVHVSGGMSPTESYPAFGGEYTLCGACGDGIEQEGAE